jgi:hypothetical protein
LSKERLFAPQNKEAEKQALKQNFSSKFDNILCFYFGINLACFVVSGLNGLRINGSTIFFTVGATLAFIITVG